MTIKSVADENGLGFDSIQEYIDHVDSNTEPGNHSFGSDASPDPNYFNKNALLDNVAETGTYLGGIEALNEQQLLDLGLDLSQFGSSPGSQTFGFSVDRSLLPEGDFIAHLSPECGNDIIALASSTTVSAPGIDIEKSTNGVDGDTRATAIALEPGAPITWEYLVTNTGNVPFTFDEVAVWDDQIPVLDFISTSDVGGDGILSPGEVWTYQATGVAEDLSLGIEFEPDGLRTELAPGTTIDNQYSEDLGLTVSTYSLDKNGDLITEADPVSRATIFDSSRENLEVDADLGTPNASDGPGEGKSVDRVNPGDGDTEKIEPGDGNTKALDNILILSKEPGEEDDDLGGGAIRFDFNDPVWFNEIGLIDIEYDSGLPSYIRLFDENDELISVDLPGFEFEAGEGLIIPQKGDNSVQYIDFDGVRVSAVEVFFNKESGGITDFSFWTPETDYKNIGIVEVPGATDEDPSYYLNPFPGIDIEKFTNGVDGDTVMDAAVVPPNTQVTWEYHVSNTGNVYFDQTDVLVTDDDPSIIPVLDAASDLGNDGILSPGERWIYRASAPAQDLTVSIDFETDGNGNALAAGDLVDTAYQERWGLTISNPTKGMSKETTAGKGAMIFDSANPTGGDDDLYSATEGNILIISENGNSDNPDDAWKGGTLRFEWDDLVRVNQVGVFDTEEGGIITTYDAEGNKIGKYDITEVADGGFATVNLNNELVTRMDIKLHGSGAITGLEFDPGYQNIGSVSVNGWPDVFDADASHYFNSGDGLELM